MKKIANNTTTMRTNEKHSRLADERQDKLVGEMKLLEELTNSIPWSQRGAWSPNCEVGLCDTSILPNPTIDFD